MIAKLMTSPGCLISIEGNIFWYEPYSWDNITNRQCVVIRCDYANSADFERRNHIDCSSETSGRKESLLDCLVLLDGKVTSLQVCTSKIRILDDSSI